MEVVWSLWTSILVGKKSDKGSSDCHVRPAMYVLHGTSTAVKMALSDLKWGLELARYRDRPVRPLQGMHSSQNQLYLLFFFPLKWEFMGFKWLPQWRKLSCGPSWLWNRPVRPPLNLHSYENGIIWSSQHLKRHLRASHDTYRCEKWILGPSQQWNRDLHSSENGFIWSSQHLNRCPRALHDLYSCEKWICGT